MRHAESLFRLEQLEASGLRRGPPPRRPTGRIMREVRMREIEGRPGDRRGFIHKKILGGISKISGLVPIPGAGAISRITGALAGRGRAVGPPMRGFGIPSETQKEFGRSTKFGGESLTTTSLIPKLGCVWPFREDPITGECKLFAGDRPGPNGGEPVGDAVMGQYGAGLTPGVMNIRRAVCLRGMQLGNDGVCYNKSQISNKQRMWPAGRKPLLTGGDMRAISTASRAGKRMDVATKRLQKMGMMKKPVRRTGPTRHQALLEAHVATRPPSSS